MMWLAVTVATMASSLTLLNSRIKKSSNFFLFICGKGIDKCGKVWYNRGGGERAGNDSEGPNSRSDYPYAIFPVLLAHMQLFLDFPKLITIWPYI